MTTTPVKTWGRETLYAGDLNAVVASLQQQIDSLSARLDSAGLTTNMATRADLDAHKASASAHTAHVRVATLSADTAVGLWTYDVDLGSTPPLVVSLAPQLGAAPIAVLIQKTSEGDIYVYDSDEESVTLDGDADTTARLIVIGHS